MVINDHRERIIAAVQVDRLFDTYEIEMNPEEAVTFVEVAPLVGVSSSAILSTLIQRINGAIPPIDFGPEHPETGNAHHTFRIGLNRGKRIIQLCYFKGFFKPGFDFPMLWAAVNGYGLEAGAEVIASDDNNSSVIELRWEAEAKS